MSERRKLLDAFTKSHNEQGMFVAKLYDLIGEQRERAEEAEAKAKIHADAVKSLSEIRDELESRIKELESITARVSDYMDLMGQTKHYEAFNAQRNLHYLEGGA